jgi:hypothetical protein
VIRAGLAFAFSLDEVISAAGGGHRRDAAKRMPGIKIGWFGH